MKLKTLKEIIKENVIFDKDFIDVCEYSFDIYSVLKTEVESLE